MKNDFWLDRWERGETGFHQDVTNPYLLRYWQGLQLKRNCEVFVPLCGKSSDLLWLRTQGCRVLGVELSATAVRDFFSENNLLAKCISHGRFDSYEANGIRILCGDYFDLSREDLAGVSAVFDRAALIALPPGMREDYANRLMNMLPSGTQMLLITVTYPQAEMQGPPFSVSPEEVDELYSEHAELRLLNRIEVLAHNPGFKERGLSSMQENIFVFKVR